MRGGQEKNTHNKNEIKFLQDNVNELNLKGSQDSSEWRAERSNACPSSYSAKPAARKRRVFPSSGSALERATSTHSAAFRGRQTVLPKLTAVSPPPFSPDSLSAGRGRSRSGGRCGMQRVGTRGGYPAVGRCCAIPSQQAARTRVYFSPHPRPPLTQPPSFPASSPLSSPSPSPLKRAGSARAPRSR